MRAAHARDERNSLVARAAIGQHGRMKNIRPVLVCAGLILMLAMGVRQTMGLLMPPMTIAHGWSRDDFALAIAFQNLLWGVSVPFAGAIADRFGAGRVLVASAALYALGLALMALSPTPVLFGLSAGVMIGLALSGTTFGVVLGVVAKVATPERRSVALGIVSAGGSFGQFAMVPYGQALIGGLGWYAALFVLAATVALIVPLAAGLGGRASKKGILTWIYALRSLLIALLLMAPKTPITLYAFAFGMGLLWLSTVPLTNALVAQIFGLKHMSMLSGLVFFGHQIGGFLGAWVGGLIFTRQGSYDLAWWISIGLGIFAAIVCAPINELPLARAAPALAAPWMR